MIICCPQLGISPESTLGGEVYDREIIKGLDELGVKTLIILPLFKKHPVLKNAKIYRLPLPFIYPPIIFNLLILPYLFFLKRKYDFKTLRIHNPYFVGIGAQFFGRHNLDIKLLPSYLHLEDDAMQKDLDKRFIKNYKTITTISKATKDEIVEQYGVDENIIKIIPCGIDPKYQPAEKDEFLVKKYNLQDKKVLLYLGQLIERKNVPFLIKLMKDLPEEYVLLIVGSGPLFNNLRNSSKDKRVIFTGKINEADKVKYYNLADIFLYSSLKEGFGMSVCEALNCKVRVIAHKLPVFEELKSSGLTLLKLNASDWIKEIKRPIKKDKSFRLNLNWLDSAKKFYELSKN